MAPLTVELAVPSTPKAFNITSTLFWPFAFPALGSSEGIARLIDTEPVELGDTLIFNVQLADGAST